MTMREEPFRWLKWGMLLPILVLNGWLLIQLFEYFSSLISIFISANLLAFVLNYPVQWLERHRLSRVRAVTVVFLLALSAVVLLAVTVVPIVVSQLSDFVNRLPDWIGSGSQQLEELQNWAIARRFPIDLTRLINQLQDGLSERLQELSGQLFSFGVGLVGRTLDCLLTLVFTFYLLLHGDRL
ncbi:MAG TPA: AI-2E family transporter, partial [Chroococcidiopsis sp.]